MWINAIASLYSWSDAIASIKSHEALFCSKKRTYIQKNMKPHFLNFFLVRLNYAFRFVLPLSIRGKLISLLIPRCHWHCELFFDLRILFFWGHHLGKVSRSRRHVSSVAPNSPWWHVAIDLRWGLFPSWLFVIKSPFHGSKKPKIGETCHFFGFSKTSKMTIFDPNGHPFASLLSVLIPRGPFKWRDRVDTQSTRC